MCQEQGVAVIARVPFDEGSLTGTMTVNDTWPQGDWRNLYFTPENLGRRSRASSASGRPSAGMGLPELALRFILHHPAVTTSSRACGRSPRRAEPGGRDGSPFPASCWRPCAGTGGTGTTVIP